MRTLAYFFLLLLMSCTNENSPDAIYIGGKILTVDKNNSVAEAVAIKDGLIIQVGKKSDVLKTATDATKIIHLQGQTLIPGFVASHEHPTLTAVFSETIDVSGFTFSSSKEMWLHLREQVNQIDEGEWIYAMGLDPVLMPDLIMPNKQLLDEISPNNPLVIISQTMHSFWANSHAFAEAGITKNSSNPGNGSYYDKDEQGELNGFISESAAADPLLKNLQSPLGVINRYENTLQNLVEAGFTSVASLGYNMPAMLARYASSDWFSPRIRQFIYLSEKEINNLPGNVDNGDDFYQIKGIKLWHDGSPYTGTMALEENYLNNELTKNMWIPVNHKGEPRMTNELFTSSIKEYNEQGWQLAVHSQGDYSNHKVLQSFQSILTPQDKPLRHRFEHCLLISKETLAEFSVLSLTPSFHINHIYYYGDDLAKNIIGEQRAQQVLPVKAAFDLGLHPTLHADSPMFPVSPLSLMETAVTRKTKSGLILGIEQSITAQQALKAVTYNAAWQLHMEDKIGSIEVGKYADFTLLSGNPYELPVQEWKNISVKQVWLEGENKL